MNKIEACIVHYLRDFDREIIGREMLGIFSFTDGLSPVSKTLGTVKTYMKEYER